MQELDQLIREKFDYYFTQIHTTFPAVVVEYDAATRRATVQPSLKRKAGNKEYVEFPLLIDVPVQYPGTKKFTIHFPLEKGDEVAVFFSERAIELWKATGMDKIEDPDPRRFSLPDAYCTPGLQALEFISAVSPKALEIIHKTGWDGDFISDVIMDDDMIQVRYKKKCKVFMEDDHMRLNTQNCSYDMTASTIVIDNGGGSSITLNPRGVQVKGARIDLN